MDRRLLVLPIAAAILTAMTVWKLNRTYEPSSGGSMPALVRPAPLFEALDSQNELVRLERYVGRHAVIVVFYDGQSGADHDPALLKLRERFAEIEAADAKVIAVSGALPQENREAMRRGGAFPFPLVTDVPPAYTIHRQWGRFDERSGRPIPGVFLVDRQGHVAWSQDAPQPLSGADEALARLTG